MSELVPAFFNVNEEGTTYGKAHADLDSALAVLEEFPNDTITVRLVTLACLRYLRDPGYDLDHALRDGMADYEYRAVTAEGPYLPDWNE